MAKEIKQNSVVKHKCRKCGKVIENWEAKKIEQAGMPSWYCSECYKEI